MTDKFLMAVAKTLLHEGGYVNDPKDPGGETNFGISKRSYPELDIRHLTVEEARAIYYRDYWAAGGYELIASEALAEKAFDLAVNMGPGRAHRLLQKAVNAASPAGLTVDGKLGLQTLQAVNEHPYQEWLLAELRLQAVAYYLGLGKDRYLSGWIRRALD